MNQTIKLDTRKCDGAYGKARIATLRRGERNNALLTVKVCANGQPYDLSGKTASLVATTAAGKLVGPCPMEVADAGIARIMLPAALYSAVGSFSGYVEIRDGETLVDTTDRFGGKVIECADLDSEQAAEFTPLLGELQNAVAEEAKRVEAEKARAQAETERETGFAEAKQAAQTATTAANDAAAGARSAAGSASDAAESANTAAGKATDAAGLAETAKTNANTAAEEANAAATKAEASARKADGAAETAGTAASTAAVAANKADTAAGNAGSMAEKADASANKADIAAGKANEATVAATNAATKANEVEAKLTGNILKGNVKDTFIHVDDAFPSTLLGIEIEGATKQVTTTGAQLIDPDGIDTTVGGLNIVRNADGSITVNKTATGYVWYTHDSNIVLEAGTYTISGATDKVSVFVTRISDGGTIGSQTSSVKSTFTVAETETAKIMIRLSAGNYTNYSVYTMLQHGSVATAYEPYTGGKPSPSPEYPQEITVVKNPTLKVTGRNLMDCDKGINECFTKNSDGTYTITKVAKNNRFSKEIPCRVLKGSKIYISGAHTLESTSDCVSMELIFDDGQHRTVPFINENRTAVVANAGLVSVKFYVESTVAEGASFTFAPQVEYGTEATAYAPYVGISQAFTLPAEHPYLAKLPDGTADEIIVDKDGNVELVARVGKFDTSNLNKPSQVNALDNGLTSYAYKSIIKPPATIPSPIIMPNFESVVDSKFFKEGCYAAQETLLVGTTNDPTETIRASGYLYYKLATPVVYTLGKIEMPKAQDSVSNVWTDAEVTPRTGIEYTRDVNIVVANLESAIASITQG